MQEDNGKEDDVTIPTDVAMSCINKVQAWLESNSDEIIFTSAASTISPASCIILSEDDDDDNVMQKADTLI